MTRKTTEDLETLTNEEISNRLQKTLKKVKSTFAAMIIFAVASSITGFYLNSVGQGVAGSIVSVSSAIIVICAALYMRSLRRSNDELIEVSKRRNGITS